MASPRHLTKTLPSTTLRRWGIQISLAGLGILSAFTGDAATLTWTGGGATAT